MTSFFLILLFTEKHVTGDGLCPGKLFISFRNIFCWFFFAIITHRKFKICTDCQARFVFSFVFNFVILLFLFLNIRYFFLLNLGLSSLLTSFFFLTDYLRIEGIKEIIIIKININLFSIKILLSN